MKPTLIICQCLLFLASTQAQRLPSSNIYLFQIKQVNDSLFRFENGMFLTGFNAKGYNNQPQFFSKDELFITVQTPTDTTQTDIYALDLKNRSRRQVTATEQSEYSPTLMPDRTNFSVVRVETDKTQKLWQYPLDLSDKGFPVLKSITGMGYHAWLSAQQLALFMVDEPSFLLITDLRDERQTKLTSDIGRCFQKLPNGNLAYVYKATRDTWYIQELDLTNLQSKIIVKTLKGSEDFALMPDGTMLMGQGSVLYKFHPAFDTSWLPAGDFRDFGIKNIMRLAVNEENKLAMVAN